MIDLILERIGNSVPTQRKKIDKFFVQCPEARVELSGFLEIYRPFMAAQGISLDLVVDSYLELVNQMLHSRLEFARNGCYPLKSQSAALSEVYRNQNTMQQYMLGLALSYFLWRHQFQLLTFYREAIHNPATWKRCMEVGCGHGLLLMELLKRAPAATAIDVIDISRQSIHMTMSLLRVSLPEDRRCFFHHSDIFQFRTEERYDFITVGEVLEHVENPGQLLARLAGLLAPGGRLFVTTCANCPAIDHVYHFRNIGEIRELTASAGLLVVRDLVAPSEQRDMLYLERNKVDISYAAILERKGDLK